MTISTIGILGAGAVGASVASMFAEALASGAPGVPSVALVADGARAERLSASGVTVNGRTHRLPVVQEGQFDLLIVATKSIHLEAALPLAARAAGPRALVMSLLNGITSEGILAAAVGAGRVVPAMILGIDAMPDGNGYRYLNRGTIHYGEEPGRYPVAHAALDAIRHAFESAAIPCRISDDITRTLWLKFMINVGINQASAILGGTYGLFQQSEEARLLMREAMQEVLDLSQLEGTGLTAKDIDDFDTTLRAFNPDGRTSMLQDMDARRPTEVGIFAGTVMEIACRHGLPVPVNRTLYRIIRVLESNHRGGTP